MPSTSGNTKLYCIVDCAAIAAAFSLPLLYDKNEDFVDAHLGKGLAELEKVYKKVEDQVLTLLNRKQKKTD